MKLTYALLAAAFFTPLFARAQEPAQKPQKVQRTIEFHGPGRMGPMVFGGPDRMYLGIPPHLAAKLGVPEETQKKIQQLTFQANEQLINFEAEVKRAQLELEKALAAAKPDQNSVMSQIDRVTRAEAEVRKNRIGLMLKIREALGPELWQKLEAQMTFHRQIKINKVDKLPGSMGHVEIHEGDDVEGFDIDD